MRVEKSMAAGMNEVVAVVAISQWRVGHRNTIFTIVFSDGERRPCVTGNAVDFVRYPPGKGPFDVVAVIPHEGRRDGSLVISPDWY